jgi:hypothetical protein
VTLLRFALRLASATALLLSAQLGAAGRSLTVPQCTGVTLEADYLAQVTAAEGPGFLLVITNNTDQPIKLARPLPTSVHWYAQVGSGPWLWRASSGGGGALADAMREHGPLLAYARAVAGARPEYLTVGAHQRLETAESMQKTPTLRFRPGCERCRNPQDERFRAVLAYAYLPAPGETGVLSCGLRSGPVVMPPLP